MTIVKQKTDNIQTYLKSAGKYIKKANTEKVSRYPHFR